MRYAYLRSIAVASLSLLGTISVFGAEGTKPQVEAYVPKADNQLMSLGGTKQSRFKLQDITWPEKPGDAEVCLWYDDLYAAASITIDDNCKPDHAWWLKQCEKHGIKVTWFVITNGVNGENKGFNGTWEDWKKLTEAGCAVQSHTTNHFKSADKAPEADVREQYGASRYALENQIPGNSAVTLAYPYGRGNHKLAGEYYIAVRGTFGGINAANKTNYLNTAKGGITQPFIDALLGKKVTGKLKWLNNPSYKRGWIAPLYHYVPHGHTKEEKAASKQKAEEDVANLAKYKDQIWIDTFVAVAKYGQERDSAALKTVSSSASKIELSLSDRMRDDIFDQPLTIKVRLPDSWKSCKAKQDGKEIKAKFVTHDSKPYALVYGVPDKGKIEISQ